MELPLKKVAAECVDPRMLIVYSRPKVGKTSALALLEDNLIIDTEGGTAYVEALKVRVNKVQDILTLCKEIKKAGNPYKFITLDTITALEDMAKPFALELWKASPLYTTKYEVTDITQVPNGSGCLVAHFW